MSPEMRNVLEGVRQIGDELSIDFWYPRNEGAITRFVVGLMDVRAADDIRVSYDFERDGWKIEQASTFQWSAEDEICDPDWKEVAFIQAWKRKEARDKDLSQEKRG